MNIYELPTYTTIKGKDCSFETDYRVIIKIFQILNDVDLTTEEKIHLALNKFYKTKDFATDVELAWEEFTFFINVGEVVESSKNDKPLYEWDKDFSIIIAPINKAFGSDIRGVNYLHWWTFLSYFMEIGECTFSTFVSIRNKINKGIRLEKYEEKIYKENRDKITLKKKVDSTTQSIINQIMGKE